MTYRGHTIERGAYEGTSDDRADRWYWTCPEADAVDRTGRGYATQREAQAAVDAHIT